mmetsp:Transcript_25837/g.60577  ORF Transcript_25837/g.60577 Transcript_25837/m.60577 type:complete len:223 (-) Transcript_25837:455-1123(-)
MGLPVPAVGVDALVHLRGRRSDVRRRQQAVDRLGRLLRAQVDRLQHPEHRQRACLPTPRFRRAVSRQGGHRGVRQPIREIGNVDDPLGAVRLRSADEGHPIDVAAGRGGGCALVGLQRHAEQLRRDESASRRASPTAKQHPEGATRYRERRGRKGRAELGVSREPRRARIAVDTVACGRAFAGCKSNDRWGARRRRSDRGFHGSEARDDSSATHGGNELRDR